MPALDAKQFLVDCLRQQHARYVKDLLAIPEEARGKSHSGCARSPLYMTAECAALNSMIAEFLRTGESGRPNSEDQEALFNSVTTTDRALGMLEESITALVAAYEGLDGEAVGEIIDRPFGRPAQRFMPASLPIFHLVYHDGQLNYIQTLLGDDKIHW